MIVFRRTNTANGFLFFLLLFAISCAAEDDNNDDNIWTDLTGPITNDNERGNYNILIIGNSLSRDAFSYVPAIVNNLCPNISIEMDIYYKGGIALNAHWNSIVNEINDHSLDSYTTENGEWTTQTKAFGKDVFNKKNWDIIILQEGNVKSRYYTNTQPNIEYFVSYIRSLPYETKIGYMINPAQPEGSSVLGDLTSNEVWELFALTARELLENNDVDYIIPCGTAIQNARQTYLDTYGSWGHLTYEGIHLQEGVPCYIDALAASQALMNILGIEASIENTNLHITPTWVKKQNIPGQHGQVVEGSREDYLVSKKCALHAIAHPYSLIDIEE